LGGGGKELWSCSPSRPTSSRRLSANWISSEHPVTRRIRLVPDWEGGRTAGGLQAFVGGGEGARFEGVLKDPFCGAVYRVSGAVIGESGFELKPNVVSGAHDLLSF